MVLWERAARPVDSCLLHVGIALVCGAEEAERRLKSALRREPGKGGSRFIPPYIYEI